MAKFSALERERRVSDMRDRLTEYATGNNPPAERIRAADIALKLISPDRYNLDRVRYNALVSRARQFVKQHCD